MKKFILSLLCLFMVVGCSSKKEEIVPMKDPYIYGKESKNTIFIHCSDELEQRETIAYFIYTNLYYETLGVNCFREEHTNIFDDTFSYDDNANENAWNLIEYCVNRLYKNDPTLSTYFTLQLNYSIKYLSDDAISSLKNEFSTKIEKLVNHANIGVHFLLRINEEIIISEYFIADKLKHIKNEHDH